MDENVKQAVASLMKDRSKREALAAMITEFVQPNHITTDFIGLLLNSRRLNPGDSLVKKLRKGISVHTLVPGSIHLKNEITVTDRVNYILDGADVGVTANEWELENGEIGTVEEIKREMMAKLKDYYYGKVFTSLTTVWSAVNTPDNYTNMGGAITATALEDAIDRINQTTSGAKAVVGLRSAMTPITKFGAFWDNGAGTIAGIDPQLAEVVQRGMLGKYYGVPLIVLDQTYDNLETNSGMLPADKILVIGENVGEFVTFGDVKTKEWTDPRPTPPQWNVELWQQFGLMVWNASGLYVIGGIS